MRCSRVASVIKLETLLLRALEARLLERQIGLDNLTLAVGERSTLLLSDGVVMPTSLQLIFVSQTLLTGDKSHWRWSFFAECAPVELLDLTVDNLLLSLSAWPAGVLDFVQVSDQ